jgi:dihydrodipicolinate synthase/N-acetylneuraminate lyase
VGGLRGLIEHFPRHAALEHMLVRRGVAVREDVRRPLRALTAEERSELDAALTPWLGE